MQSLIATIVLLSLISVSPDNSKQRGDHVKEPNNAATQRQNGGCLTPVPSTLNQVAGSQATPDKSRDQRKDINKYGDILNWASTALIAVFTALTFFVFKNQLRSSKIAERAWIVPNLDSKVPSLKKLDPLIDLTIGVSIVCLIENRGRTPAWITEMGSRASLVDQKKALPSDRKYDWASPFPTEGTVLPPNANIEQGFHISLDDLYNMEVGASNLYVYGIVRYRDIYGDKHETRYCYIFRRGTTTTNPAPRGFYIDGPQGYNGAT